MANNLTSNPLIVDTAGAGTVIVTSNIWVTKIHWSGAVANKTATVKDKGGTVRWKQAIGAGSSPTEPVIIPDSDFNPPLHISGLIVEDIASAGEIHIYLDQSKTPIPVKTT